MFWDLSIHASYILTCVLGALCKFWRWTWSEDCQGFSYIGGMPGTVTFGLYTVTFTKVNIAVILQRLFDVYQAVHTSHISPVTNQEIKTCIFLGSQKYENQFKYFFLVYFFNHIQHHGETDMFTFAKVALFIQCLCCGVCVLVSST